MERKLAKHQIWVSLLGTIWVAATFATEVSADWRSCCGNPVHWSSPYVTLNASPISYPTGSVWRTRIEDAAQSWTSLGETEAIISIGDDADGWVGLGNQQSEIWYTTAASATNAIMATFVDYTDVPGCVTEPCCNGCTPPTIVESDIIVYPTFQSGESIPWKAKMPVGTDTADSTYFFVASMVHEMGHALGLEHSANGMARMSTTDPFGGWFNSGSNTVFPLPQDRMDANSLYPRSTSYTNVYTVNFQDAPQRSHQSKLLSYNPDTDTPYFYPHNNRTNSNSARRGESFSLRACFGNLGNVASSSTKVNITLSTDTMPSSDDVFCGATNLTFPAYSRSCSTYAVSIPTSTRIGTYYVLYTIGNGNDDTAVLDRKLQVTN